VVSDGFQGVNKCLNEYKSARVYQLLCQGKSKQNLLLQTATMKFLLSLVSLSLSAAFASADPIVYLIRHGEKPSDGGNGLSAQGEQRAQCLRNVFGDGSGYDIGYIMAQTPDSGRLPTRVPGRLDLISKSPC
jgi:hypothetical protein